MTFTFKLSRRLARLRSMPLLVALVATTACAGENLNEPSDPVAATDPTAVTIYPDSTSLPVDGDTQFTAEPTSNPPAGAVNVSSSRWSRFRREAAIKVSLDPDRAVVAAGGRKTFRATAASMDGTAKLVRLSWRATGGQIDGSGHYVAGKRAGTYAVIVSTGSGLSDTATITILATQQLPTAGAIAEVVVTPAKPALKPGASVTFSAEGRAVDGSPIDIAPLYSASAGSISATGKYTAPGAAGSYSVIAEDPASGKADTAAVTVSTDAPVVDKVSLTPATASIPVGSAKQLTAAALDAGGNALPNQSISWSSANVDMATVSPSGLVSAVAAGTVKVTASAGGKSALSTITVTAPNAPDPVPGPTPQPPAPSDVAGCPSSGYDRLVEVSSQSQLVNAINDAQPGDQIRLAAGNYSGGLKVSRNGTSNAPITLCGPRSAVFNQSGGSYTVHQADWWVYSGFRIVGGLYGIWTEGANNNLFDGLLIEEQGQEAFVLKAASSSNTLTRSTIRTTGRTMPQYGEAVYIGNSAGGDASNNNRIVGNSFGPDVTAEHVDIKPGATGNLVQSNTSNAAGYQWISQMTTALYITDGTGSKFLDNVVTNLNSPSATAFQSWQGSQGVWQGNKINGNFTWGFAITGGSGNTVSCDNSVSGGSFSSVPCK